MGYVDVGLSQSTSQAARSNASGSAGQGDFNISAGGQKQTSTLYIVVGLVAVAFVVIFFLRK